jgi:hypothetical protein
MMKPAFTRRMLSKVLVAVLILAGQTVLPALARASHPDPSWIPGIYDDADHDDVILLVSSSAGSVAPAARDEVRPPLRVVGRLGYSQAWPALTLPASAIHSRAPPAS